MLIRDGSGELLHVDDKQKEIENEGYDAEHSRRHRDDMPWDGVGVFR
jgi:hypothetical protein